MIVFPLKFFPWMMIFAGIVLLCMGETIAWAIVMLVIGLIWAGFQVAGMVNKRKAKQGASSAQKPYSQPIQPPIYDQPSKPVNTQPSQPVNTRPSQSVYVQPPQPVYAQQPPQPVYNQYSHPVYAQQPPQPVYAQQPPQPVYAQQPLKPVSRCPRCQNETIEGAVFCGKCGYKLK
jgi:hypothetical protein